MAKVEEKFQEDLDTLWEVITDRTGRYRTDLREVKKLGEGHYLERDADNQRVEIFELVREKNKHYKVEMKSRKVDQVFEVFFEGLKDGSLLTFTLDNGEEERPKSLFSFFYPDQQKILNRMVYDIKQRISN